MASSLSVLLLLCLAASASAQLSPRFYGRSCPRALAIIRRGVTAAVRSERRMGASLLRLHFHDCFVQGCDASVLLSDTATFTGEQGAGPNAGSIRGMNVIDNIKAQVEAVCAQTVSCADILAVAARDSVVALGGPSWTVPLGRRDSTTASMSLANSDLPPPSFDIANLTANFAAKGAQRDRHGRPLRRPHHRAGAVPELPGQALQRDQHRDGLRDISQGQLPPADRVRRQHPGTAGHDDAQRIRQRVLPQPDVTEGLLHSDQVLINDGRTAGLVRTYSSASTQLNRDFAAAMVKMGNISPLTGAQGQVRLSCSRVN
ncbi:hypothetical protein ZWY2020_038023 [Hordeum vulgare]|nr:hypothetical protein ZWY2020_038023 [Hordeum vulgare]